MKAPSWKISTKIALGVAARLQRLDRREAVLRGRIAAGCDNRRTRVSALRLAVPFRVADPQRLLKMRAGLRKVA